MHSLRVGHNLIGRVEIARVRAAKGQPLEFDINCFSYIDCLKTQTSPYRRGQAVSG